MSRLRAKNAPFQDHTGKSRLQTIEAKDHPIGAFLRQEIIRFAEEEEIDYRLLSKLTGITYRLLIIFTRSELPSEPKISTALWIVDALAGAGADVTRRDLCRVIEQLPSELEVAS
jgi:hypothetical protein